MNILNKRNRGFTLVEVLVVLIILTGIAVMFTKSTGGGRRAALVQQTKIDMNGRIKTAIIARAAAVGRVLTKDDLTVAALGLDATTGLNDPFKQPYKLTPNGAIVTIAPQEKGQAEEAGVPNVSVDVTPYI
ncbi:MAG: type II secretion system GspH family protein [Puniceicoccales bacterium]|jgi:prepilin-type N-terminal cleavage/methylation domain-containing protein|nr:type II secretion system GspH family protein [Puniceicoccales bacterium]